MRHSLSGILFLLIIATILASCGRKAVPAVGAEKKFDEGLRTDKSTLRIFPKDAGKDRQ
jgi:hypothetical protein